MVRTRDRFLYSNRLSDGSWDPQRALLVAPDRVVDLGSTTRWEPATSGGQSRFDLESLTCVRTGRGRLVALRRLHATAKTWQAITVHGVWLHDNDPPQDLGGLRSRLRVEAGVVASRCAMFRGRPTPDALTLDDLTNGPPHFNGDVPHAVTASVVRELLSGRRVAVVGATEAECADVVFAVLAALPASHLAQDSWSTLESDGLGGLALIGLVKSLWRGAPPEDHGYVAIYGGSESDREPADRGLVDPGGQWSDASEVNSGAASDVRRCPACGIDSLAEVRYSRLQRGRPPDSSDPLSRAIDTLRTYRCGTCHIHIQHEDPTPIVVLGSMRSGKSDFVTAALSGSQTSTTPPHLSSLGIVQKADPWRVSEMSAHGGSGTTALIALEADQGADWMAPLRRIAGRPGGGLAVVCVDAAQLSDLTPRGAARPSCLSESVRLHRDIAQAIATNPGWYLMTAVTRAPEGAAAGDGAAFIERSGASRMLNAGAVPAHRRTYVCVEGFGPSAPGAPRVAYEAMARWLNRRSTQ